MKNLSKNFIWALVILMFISAAYSFIAGQFGGKREIPLSELVSKINSGEVVKISVVDSTLEVVMKDGSEARAEKENEAGITETLKNYGVDQEKLKTVNLQVKNRNGLNFLFGVILPILGPVALIGFFIWFTARQVQRGSMQAFTFGQSRARLISPDDKKERITFKDVAGAKEAKEELKEIVDFLKNPKKFLEIGAKIPKGVLLMGPPGSGKCVTGNTLLVTNKGVIPIDEVPKYFTVREDSIVEGLDIISLDPTTLEFTRAPASHWYQLGMQKTIGIKTDTGLGVEGTSEHPVVVLEADGNFIFKRLDEIKIGDWIVSGYNTHLFGRYTKIPNEKIAYLMGVLVGDGCLTIRNRIILSTADREILSRVQNILKDNFGNELTKTSSRPYDYELSNSRVKAELREWGLQESYAEGKRMPEWIRLAPKEFIIEFLKGIFDTDGYIEKTGVVCLSSASRRLIEDVSVTLLNVGIMHRTYERTKRYNGKKQYYLTIYGDFTTRFRNEIGFRVARKMERLNAVCARTRNTNINLIPFHGAFLKTVWDEAREKSTRYLNRAFYQEPSYKNVNRYILGRRTPSFTAMSDFIENMTLLAPTVVKLPAIAHLKKVVSEKFFFTQVNKISYGEAVVYDLTVPRFHNFIANGFINHNTLLAKAVSGEAGVPFFHMSASEFIEMFVGVGASVTGDTPVLVRRNGDIKLLPISKVVDVFYQENEEGRVKSVQGIETLGVKRGVTGFRGFKQNEEKFNFGGSQFVPVGGVLRHKVNEIYEIHYLGGVIRTTGDHSIFVREKNYIRVKRADELKAGDTLVNLPYKVRSVFVPGFGTTHKVKAHIFDMMQVPELTIWGVKYRDLQMKYEFALSNSEKMLQREIGARLGVSQATAGNWINGIHKPKFFNSPSIHRGLPSKVIVTPEMMRLFGYYVAEGRTETYSIDFVFGTHEKDLHKDCEELLQKLFSITPRVKDTNTNSTRIIVSSRPLAELFEGNFGTGSHKKHLPEWIWTLPWPYIYEFIKGYSRGDGYHTKDKKLSMVSVSHQLIREITWLLGMHGIQVGIRKVVTPAGRRIKEGGKPLPESIAWNIIVGKTSNLWSDEDGIKNPNQFKRSKVVRVVKKSYDGYVYDLVGCGESEAFFGGEKPLLLHNSRTRDLFRLAKKAAPSIIFIDELDAVGRVRGAGLGGGHDEREQTLNQILVEMDGMETDDRVIITAATNRPDVLDPALLRPGRFDRRVVLDLPDINDREEILKIHAKNKPLEDEVHFRTIAERTPGFSGADLANLVNEAAILAARENKKKVGQLDLISSIEKVMMGPERKSHILSQEEKRICAYHEAGHGLVAASLKHTDPVHKISIVSRGRAAGYTLKLPSADRHLYSRSHFLDELASALGGYAAELLVFNEITTGPHDDLKKATDLARSLVTRFGMSEKIGPITLGDKEELIFLGREISTERNYSEETSRLIDSEVKKLLDDAYARAKEVLLRRRAKLDEVAGILIEKESIEREEFEKIVKEEKQ